MGKVTILYGRSMGKVTILCHTAGHFNRDKR
jgi:hypothetical protein